jgi:hypothetical protein
VEVEDEEVQVYLLIIVLLEIFQGISMTINVLLQLLEQEQLVQVPVPYLQHHGFQQISLLLQIFLVGRSI